MSESILNLQHFSQLPKSFAQYSLLVPFLSKANKKGTRRPTEKQKSSTSSGWLLFLLPFCRFNHSPIFSLCSLTFTRRVCTSLATAVPSLSGPVEMGEGMVSHVLRVPFSQIQLCTRTGACPPLPCGPADGCGPGLGDPCFTIIVLSVAFRTTQSSQEGPGQLPVKHIAVFKP